MQMKPVETPEWLLKKVTTRIDRARWWALTNQPFYGSLAMRLPDKITTHTSTAHTDGRSITWNPLFVQTLSDEELRFVLLHETLHCAHQHMWRLPADERGNIAGDHEINLTLQGIHGISMPEGGLADPQFAGMACEEIFARLPESEDEDEDKGGDGEGDEGDDQSGGGASGSGKGESKDQGQQPSQGGKPDPCGSFGPPASDPAGDGEGDGQEDPQAKAQASQELRDQWEGAVIQAAQAAQALGQGDIPGDMQRELDRVRAKHVDWRREMSDFVKSAASDRNDWTRSSRRMATAPVIYPRKRADELGKVVFVRDTSGSVSDEQLAQYSALITECIAETGCTAVVIDADSAIRDEFELLPGERCPLEAKGGGGTDFRPAFNRADEMVLMGEQIAGLVYITDLMGTFPAVPGFATLWLNVPGPWGGYANAAPFGRTVKVEK